MISLKEHQDWADLIHKSTLNNLIPETQESINEWQSHTFPDATEEGIKNHLKEEFQEFLDATSTDEALTEAADLIILVYAWAGKVDKKIHPAINKKMQINRKRDWNIQQDGTGRHR